MQKMTWYDSEVKPLEGAPCGTKEELLAWAKEHFGNLEKLESQILAGWFFHDGPTPKTHGSYRTEEGKCIVLAEVQ